MASYALLSHLVERQTRPPNSLPVKVGTDAQGVSVQATCGVFMALSWITVILRFYTRGVLVRNIGADDIWILAAVIFFSVYNLACIIITANTMGDVYLRVDSADLAFNWLMVAEAFYVVTMCALKVSVSIFFLRVMIKPWQRWVIYVSLVLATLINIAYFFVIVFQCGVPKGGINFMTKQLAHQCLKPAEFLGVSYAHGAVSSATDIALALLPITILKESRLHIRERVTVIAILTLAAAGGIASMVRLNYVGRLATATVTWFLDANLIGIWSAVEPGLGITASSLATLRPLFRGILALGTSANNSSFHNTRYGHVPSVKTVTTATVEELGLGKAGFQESFEFIHTGFANGKHSPPPPTHQFIQKDPWKPRESSDRPGTAGRMTKAEALLGEDLSTFTPPRLGNNVSCEGPFDVVRGTPAIHRCDSQCKIHHGPKARRN